MLELRRVTKRFNGPPVVRDVSFSLSPGEIVGYLGPNGAGKTTTVRLICGLLSPSSGLILHQGVNIQRDLAAFRERVGYVPEQSDLYPHLSGFEYLELVGRMRLLPEARLRRLIPALLESLSLGGDMHQLLGAYSKGMKQKVLIAAALLHDPQILILDEPLGGLDVSSNLVFRDLLAQLSRAGKIIFYSSHLLEVLEKISTRIIVIDHGRIAADDTIDNLSRLLGQSSLESLFRRLVRHEDTQARAHTLASLISGAGA